MADSFQPTFVDLVRNFTTTAGTGNLVLGDAAPGFTSFTDALQPGDRFYYSVIGLDKTTESEVGRGTLQADGSISREPIGGVLTDFSTGRKSVALVAAAEWFESIEAVRGAPKPVETRAELAAAPGAGAALLSERGRDGLFRFDASDLSAKVAADPAQGLYVAPASDPTGSAGAWVRQFSGPVDPRWWGVVVGDDETLGAANAAAYLAMWTALTSLAFNTTEAYRVRSLHPVRNPPGVIWLDDNGSGAGIELTDGQVVFEGSGGATKGMTTATRFKVPSGVTAIRVQSNDTFGATGTGVTNYNPSGSILRDFGIEGPKNDSDTESEAHGIHLRGAAMVENVSVRWMEGDGFFVCGATGEIGGNANLIKLVNCNSTANRNGLRIAGNNNDNAGVVIGFNATSNRQWGIWESSWGQTYLGCHVDNLGTPEFGSPPCAVSYNGNQYFVIAGQDAYASANPPSGDTTDNPGWAYLGAGQPSISYPAYDPLQAYRAGGGYCVDTTGAKNCVFFNCYDEQNGTRSQVASPAIIFGGTLSLGAWRGATAGWGSAPVWRADSGGRSQMQNGVSILRGALTVNVGGSPGEFLRMNDTAVAPDDIRWRIDGNDIAVSRSNSSSQVFMKWGPQNSTAQFGSGISNTEWMLIPRLRIPDGDGLGNTNNARGLVVGTSAPTEGEYGVGSWSLDRSADEKRIGRKCLSAGAPGSWSGDIFGLTVSASAAGEALLNDADASEQRQTLGLGEAATQGLAGAADYVGNAAGNLLRPETVWAAAAPAALAAGPAVAIDFATGINFTLLVSEDCTLEAPVNAKAGQAGCVEITQDGTGGRTLGFGPGWIFPGGADRTPSSAAGSTDLLFYQVLSDGAVFCNLVKAIA